MSEKVDDWVSKLSRILLRTIFGAIGVGLFAVGVLHYFPTHPAPPPQPPPDRTPTVFYVGSHAFKVPADYSFLSTTDYGGPGNSQLIFEFYYPDFTPDDDPRFMSNEGSTPNAFTPDDLVEIYVGADAEDEAADMKQFTALRAGQMRDTVTPGPAQLLAVHEEQFGDDLPNYIALKDGVAFELWCGDPSVPLKDGTRDNECLVSFPYKDMHIDESFSVAKIYDWQDIYRKTIKFLSTHEVK